MLNVGLIGCGNIAETYFRSQEYFNNIEIVSCADINEDLAKKCANQYNVQPLSVDDLLADNKHIEYGKAAKENSNNFHWEEIIKQYRIILN